MNLIKRFLHKHGLINSPLLDARAGEYKNVFCPHCGEFIPERYRVFIESGVGFDGMRFSCDNCGRSGGVMPMDRFESFDESREITVDGRFVEESERV